MLDKEPAFQLKGGDAVIQVRFRKVTATGSDMLYGPQVVAREIKNLGEVQL